MVGSAAAMRAGIGNFAGLFVLRDIEIHAHEDAFAGKIEIANREFGHKKCAQMKRAAAGKRQALCGRSAGPALNLNLALTLNPRPEEGMIWEHQSGAARTLGKQNARHRLNRRRARKICSDERAAYFAARWYFTRVDAAIAVAPLVVVPADQLEELAVSVRGRCPASMIELCASWMKSLETTSSLGVGEDVLEIRLAGLLHRGLDFGVAGFLHGLHREVDDRDGSGWARGRTCR